MRVIDALADKVSELFTGVCLGLHQDSSLRNTAISIIVFLIMQVGLGISAVLTELPLLLVTAHNAIAAMLLLAIVNLNHLVTPGRAPVPAGVPSGDRQQ